MSAPERLGRALGALTARLRRRRREVPYKSPQEIALENAADSLGVTLGEYYPESRAIEVLPQGGEAVGGDDPRTDSAREELLTYVAALGAKRRRQRQAWRIKTTGGAVAAVAAVTAGLLALDAPAGDGERPDKAQRNPRAVNGPAMTLAATPAPLGTSVSSELDVGGGKLVNSTYLNRFGDLCSTLIEVRRGISERNNGAGCLSPTSVSADLRRQPAMVVSIVVQGRRTVIGGYARPDVERIVGRSRWGGVTVSMTRPWTPDGSDRVRHLPVRAFLAAARHGGGGRRSAALATQALDDRNYNLTAELRDGRFVPVGRFSTPGVDRRDRLVDPIPTAFAD